MLPYKTAFVVNPRAGKGRAQKVWRRLEQLLRAAGQPYRVFFTRFKGDGTGAAAGARAGGAELIIGVGGDGTLMEVVNGLDFKKNILGIIPAGTGNGFHRSLAIPGNSYQAFLGLSRWKAQLIDLGLINGTYFLNVTGLGYDAAVSKAATVDNKVLSGYPAFVAASLAKMVTFEEFRATIRIDGRTIEEKETFLVAAFNGSYYGANVCMAPQARLNDGALNLLMVRKMNTVATVALGVKALFQRHLGHEGLSSISCREVYVEADRSVPVQVDGEIYGSLPVKIKVVPGALHVLAPPLRKD